MRDIALIAGGGAAGAVLRYVVALSVQRAAGGAFPWGTLGVNLLGCFAIGLLWEWFESGGAPESWRPLVLVGLLGAFTTFSTFGLETINLLRFGPARLAWIYVGLSNVAGLALVAAGLGLGRAWFAR